MRQCYIVRLIKISNQPRESKAVNSRPTMMRSSHRGPHVKHGQADPEQVRELILSVQQHHLLQAGWIVWAGLDLTAFMAISPEGIEDAILKS